MSVRQINDQVDTCECWMDSFGVGAYIWKVCTQHMCLHVPVPLSLLHQHPLLLLVEAGFSEPGNTTDLQYCSHIWKLYLRYRINKRASCESETNKQLV